MDLDYDLSKTCSSARRTRCRDPGAAPGRSRVIHLPGYTEQEKLSIARRYLVPKQMKANGIGEENFTITRQGGAEDHPRVHARVRRAQPRARGRDGLPQGREADRLEGKETQIRVTSENVDKLLGVPRYSSTRIESEDAVGLVKGLAVTPWGGELLDIEVAVVPGKGKLILTGLLGDWLKESATAGFSYIRSRATVSGSRRTSRRSSTSTCTTRATRSRRRSVGAASPWRPRWSPRLLGGAVRKDIAMTGEITLRGRVLPIGGLKEKTMAAHRSGITRVLVPKQNEKDLPGDPEARDRQGRHRARVAPRRGAAVRADRRARARRSSTRRRRRGSDSIDTRWACRRRQRGRADSRSLTHPGAPSKQGAPLGAGG
jgi:ATP-dependent Lon protease